MNRTWINDFVEKISQVEGHFDIYVSVFLKFENQFVFGLKDTKEWINQDNKRKASFAAFGGKLEEGVDINQFLVKSCKQELDVNIEIIDSSHTYIDYHHRLKRLPNIDSAKDEMRPHIITVISKQRHTTNPNSLFFGYLGYTKNKPRSIQHSALLFAKEQILVQMFKNEKTAQELKKAGAIFEERIKIPDNLFLYPTGSLNSLLRYLSYEVF